MIEGNSIRLRAWRESDLSTLAALRNDVALQAQLLARARGSSPEQVRDWLQGGAQGDRLLFIIADRRNDNTLGFLQITDMDQVSRHANLGICLMPPARGSGFGGEAILLAVGYLRNVWNLRKLILRVRADNAGALHCYEKLGFEACGRLKQHVFVDGRWHDVVLMELFIASAG